MDSARKTKWIRKTPLSVRRLSLPWVLAGIFVFALPSSRAEGPSAPSDNPQPSNLPQDQASDVATGRVLHRHREEPSRPNAENRMMPTGKTGGALHMFWPLCIVLVLLGLCVWVVRRWMPRASRLGSNAAIRILGRHFLSGKQSLCLVRLGRRAVLIGVTPDHVSTLMEITDPEELAALVATEERGRQSSFTSMFGGFFTKEAQEESEFSPGKGEIEDGLRVSDRDLMQTREKVQELVKRVRALSSGTHASTESRQQLASLT